MLNVIRDLFSLFDKSDVKYALWKSLENIEKQVTGDDDLDILVDPQKKAEAFKICLDNGLHFNSLSKDRTGTRIHKFWGFDEETLKFVQFHIHYECAFGSKEFKEFRYPFESEMLNETISYSGVKRINDNHFFVTRILHAIAKNSKNDTFCLNLIKNWDDVAPEDQEHRLNLLNQTLGWMDSENMIRDLRKDFSKISNYQSRIAASLCKDMQSIKTDAKAFRKSQHRIYYSEIKKKLFGRNKIEKSVLLSVVGADGSGKSTVSEKTRDLLSKVMRTRRIYLGRQGWSFPNRIVDRLRSTRGLRWLKPFWLVTSTTEIYLRWFKGVILSYLGVGVIFDRDIVDLEIKLSQTFLYPIVFKINRYIDSRFPYPRLYLKAPPELAFSRTQNVSLEEIQKRQSEYDRIEKIARFSVIQNDSKVSVDQVVGKTVKLAINPNQ